MSELFGHKKCRDGCGSIITFSESERAANNTLRPLNLDGSRHTCNSAFGRMQAESRKSSIDEQAWVQQAELYLKEINRHLDKFVLRLVREPKHEQRRLQ